MAAARDAMRDSSYGVQAAALGALILLDSAGRSQWVARALAAPSYRDVIRNSALNAIARVGGATYVAAVDSLRGATATSANTLAILAVRGDSSALSALIRALDDPRAYVRDWTLRAVKRLPSELRDPPLRAIASSLRDPKTRAAVNSMLEPGAPPSQR
jgi:hypothetical protein